MTTPANSENEKFIRSLYAVAETKDSKLFTSLFTEDGYFYDVSAGIFHCYTAGTIMLGQLGVLGNLGTAISQKQQ